MNWVYQRKGSIGRMNETKDKIGLLLERFKFPLIVLGLGLLLMLIPENETSKTLTSERDLLVAEILSQVDGVGESLVLISDKGVVVVCSGANSAKTRMEIIQAVTSYTGYGSDKITILKMVD